MSRFGVTAECLRFATAEHTAVAMLHREVVKGNKNTTRPLVSPDATEPVGLLSEATNAIFFLHLFLAHTRECDRASLMSHSAAFTTICSE